PGPFDFQLQLDGILLPYTDLTVPNTNLPIGQPFNPANLLVSKTSIVSSPSNIAGTLRIVNVNADNITLFSPSALGLSAYISVVKLNSN
ncbi:MAG: hypothetical protein H0W84_11520, partial [Bacteroidetes bacterium]|nr:hypothetical protein [Bacteroidota bacterium]